MKPTKKLRVVLCHSCGKGKKKHGDPIKAAKGILTWESLTEGEQLEIKLHMDKIVLFKTTCPNCAAKQLETPTSKNPLISLVATGVRKFFSSFSPAA